MKADEVHHGENVEVLPSERFANEVSTFNDEIHYP